MKRMPFISVVLTTHRRPSLLVRALESLLSQNFSDYEIILCADESSRETREIANTLLRDCDSFISTPNLQGPAGTRNIGITLASGEWICFLDDDDSLSGGYFEMASAHLQNSNNVHFFNFTEIKEERLNNSIVKKLESKKDLSNISADQLFLGNFIPLNALFVPNGIAKLSLFDLTLQSHEDWDWLVSLRSKSNNFSHHNFYGPNVHIDTSSSRNSDAINSGSRTLDFLSIYRKWPANSEEIRHKREEIMSGMGLPIPNFFL